MIEYRAAENYAYDLAADEPAMSVDLMASTLMERFDISADDAYDIAAEVLEDEDYTGDQDDWDYEMGFDPYEGCWTGDC